MRNPFKRKNKKYYLVMYSFSNATGFIVMTSENMDYINKDKSIKLIKDIYKNTQVVGNVIITNIIKISKKEYDCWIKEEK